MIFYLKTQAGWRETDRHEHVSATTIEVVDRFEGSEKLAAYIDGIAARQAGCIGVVDDPLIAADPYGGAGGRN
jgi:hypothetical protein